MPTGGTSEMDKARADVALSELEESLRKGQLSAQQVKLIEEAQSGTPFGYDPSQTSPEAVNLITLYHAQTGEPHPTPEYMVRNFLTRRFPRENWVPSELQGQRVYSLEPNDKYHVPTIPCWLNKESPRKSEFEALGIFVICEKGGGFNNEFEIERHMQSAHRTAYNAQAAAQSRTDQREMMDLQRAMLEAQKAQMLASTALSAKPIKE